MKQYRDKKRVGGGGDSGKFYHLVTLPLHNSPSNSWATANTFTEKGEKIKQNKESPASCLFTMRVRVHNTSDTVAMCPSRN